MSVETPVCILAYDGLEIELVEEFDFPNLKQAEYGRTDISDFDKIATPILWGSFLTGENLEPDFTEKKGSKSLMKLLRNPYHFIRNHISASLAISTRSFMKNIGVLNEVKGNIFKLNVTEDLNKKTIFDLTDETIGINIPTYSRSRTIRTSMKDRITGKISDSEYWEDVWNCFEETKREMLDNIDKDILMAWFGPADWLGHIYRKDTERMREIYQILDEFAGEIREEFDGQIFIIADHGMEPLGKFGDHTNLNYGYYSSNRELGLTNLKITDFYYIVKDIIQGEFDPEKYEEGQIEEREAEEFEGDEEEEIKKRLEDLGYFD